MCEILTSVQWDKTQSRKFRSYDELIRNIIYVILVWSSSRDDDFSIVFEHRIFVSIASRGWSYLFSLFKFFDRISLRCSCATQIQFSIYYLHDNIWMSPVKKQLIFKITYFNSFDEIQNTTCPYVVHICDTCHRLTSLVVMGCAVILFYDHIGKYILI